MHIYYKNFKNQASLNNLFSLEFLQPSWGGKVQKWDVGVEIKELREAVHELW